MELALALPGKKSGKETVSVSDESFGREYNEPLVHQTVVTYMAGARQFPSLVPIIPDNPAIPANRAAWQVLEKFERPWITAYADSDPVTRGAEKRFIETVPGAKGQAHTIIKGARHFIQDDAGDALANIVVDFIRANPM